MTRRIGRVPLLAAAMASLVWGVWLGLLRLGWPLPLPEPDHLILHGPLMIGGFLGTLIGLERAVGTGRRWAYAAPILTAAGAVLLVAGPPHVGPRVILLGSLAGVAVLTVLVRRQPSWFLATMLTGAAAWAVGNAQWARGQAIFRVVLWWVAFVVLTIAGERLELNRLREPRPAARAAFAAAVALLVAGVLASSVRIAGAGLLALAAWLAVNDIARRTVRQPGLTRFIAVCLLSGYGWLAAAGLLMLDAGPWEPGAAYDAVLHAIFLGFAVAMIFGHAPIVFPAILGLPLRYRPAFYAHLALLHVSVAARVAGDLVEAFARARSWGGLLNALALVLFVANTVSALLPRRPGAAAARSSAPNRGAGRA